MGNRMYFVNENGSRNSAQYPFVRYTTSIQYRYADELCVLLIFRDRQNGGERERKRRKTSTQHGNNRGETRAFMTIEYILRIERSLQKNK